MPDPTQFRQSPERVAEQKQKLEYMQSIIREVREMSGAENCDMVTYFLELAYVEVSDQIRKIHTEKASEDATKAS